MQKFKIKLMTHYQKLYEQIATQLFEWEGLPENIPVEYIENQLFHKGRVMFAYDENAGYFVQPFTASGMIDMYDRPAEYTVAGLSNLNGKAYAREDAVIINNNSVQRPTKELINHYIEQLVELDITKLSNQTWQRIPVIITGDHDRVQSIISLVQTTTSGDSPIAVVDKNHGMGQLELMEIKTPYLGEELRNEYKKVLGDLLTVLGIENLEVSKNERLVAAEAKINEHEVKINLLAFLEPRLLAAQRINDLFGLEVAVKVRGELNENNYIETDYRIDE